jgi:cation diffusion facilitator CzcD-associated flavoprotein CzcO
VDHPRDTEGRDRPTAGRKPSSPTIAILGAGVAGLCMAIQLKKAGISSFTLYEKADRLGGTWRDNSYPGSGCDVPSHLYCFSFEPKTDWSRRFAEQPEIQGYLEQCAQKYGLLEHIRFNTEIERARFDEREGLWRIHTRSGEEITANVLITAGGQLNRPRVPALEGLDSFEGTRFHSARWNHDHDLTGETVAAIGNGASAVQFIPRIAPRPKKLYVFQRTPNWILPKQDREYRGWERWGFRRLPFVAWLHRDLIYWKLESMFFALVQGSWVGKQVEARATAHMRSQVSDPHLREVLRPDYPIGCKRVLISDDYYPALQRPNVEVVTSPIERVTRDGITTRDGTSRPVSTIIFATGFESTSFLAPVQIEGLFGQKLADAWRDGAEAYLGVTVSGFPNLFMLYGPNTNLGHNSIIFMFECQVRYIVQCIQELVRRDLSYLDVRRHAMDRYNEELQRDIEKLSWAAGCNSWYKTASGKVTNNWSSFTVAYWWRTRRPDLGAFHQCSRS